MQDLRHGRSGHIRPLLREAAVRQVPAGMLGIRPVSYTHLDVYKRQVCSLLLKYCGHTVEPAAVLMALQGVQQLVHQIVNIKQLQLCGRIVDMDRKLSLIHI